MTVDGERPDFEWMRILLRNAKLHFKLVFGVTATRPRIGYLDTFSFGRYVAHRDELALSSDEEGHALSALEHCGTYLAATQVHTVLERVHPDPFQIREPDIAAGFQIARLLRNAFAHNPFAPVWDVRTSWSDRVFAVPEVIALDTSGLDQTAVRREHYGGPIALLRFIGYAETVVDLREKERAAQQ